MVVPRREPVRARLQAIWTVLGRRWYFCAFLAATVIMVAVLVAVEFLAVAAAGTVSHWAWPTRLRFNALPFSLASFLGSSALEWVNFPFLVVLMTFGDNVGVLIAEVSLYSVIPMIVVALLAGMTFAMGLAVLREGRLGARERGRLGGGVLVSVGSLSTTAQAFSILGGCCGGAIPAALTAGVAAGAVGGVGLAAGALALISRFGQVGMVASPLVLVGVLYYLGGVAARRLDGLPSVMPAPTTANVGGRRLTVAVAGILVALLAVIYTVHDGWWRSPAGPYQLTRHRSRAVNPSWSPDGRRIAFVSYRTAAHEIWVSDVSGKVLTQLTDTRLHKASPSWSPDGGQIAFVQSTGPTKQIWTVGVEDRALRQVTSDDGFKSSPAWNPTRPEIAYIRQDVGVIELWLVDLRTQVSRRLPGLGGPVSHPSWRSDGTALAFTLTIDGRSEIWRWDRTGELRQISRGPGNKISPAWSPDDRRLTYISDADGAARIWVMDADGGNTRTFVRGFGEPVSEVSWAPRGNRLAFVKLDRVTENASVWVVPAE